MWPQGTSNLNLKLCSSDAVKTYLFDIDNNTFEKVIWHLNIWQLFDSYTKQSEREM